MARVLLETSFPTPVIMAVRMGHDEEGPSQASITLVYKISV